MAVAFGSASSLAEGTHTNSVYTAPTGIANGDILLIWHFEFFDPTAPPTPTPPAGFASVPGTWPEHRTDTSPGTGQWYQWCWYKVASGESGNYTVTHTSVVSRGVMARVTGADGTTPITSVTQNDGVGTTSTFLTLTTSVANQLILAFGTDDNDTANNLTPPAGTTPTFTEQIDIPGEYLASGILASAGATGAKTMSNNSGSGEPWFATLVALQSASGVVTPAISVTDSATTVETVGRLLISNRSVTDSVTTGDTPTVSLQAAGQININVQDSVTTANPVTVQMAANLAVSVQDSVTTTNVPTVSPPSSTPTVNVTDSATTAEFVVIAFDPDTIFTLEVSVADSVTTANTPTVSRQSATTLGVNVADSVTTSSTGNTESLLSFVNVTDAVSAIDSVSVTLPIAGNLTINVQDAVAHAETTSLSGIVYRQNVTDAIATAESVFVQLFAAGQIPSTHPPLGGLPNEGSAGGLPNEGSGGGTVVTRRSGGTPVVRLSGGTPVTRLSGGTVLVPSIGGEVQEPDTGGDIE